MGIYENMDELPLKDGVTARSYKEDFDKEQLDEFASRISEQVDSNELFKNPEINIQLLAEEVSISPRQVSHTINLYFHTNFSDFINGRRLSYAKKQLEAFTNEEKNISQIIFESGFNSKSSFYTYFKRNEGCSPKEYRINNSR